MKRKKKEDRLSEGTYVYFTPKEYAILKRKAGKQGMSDFVRTHILPLLA